MAPNAEDFGYLRSQVQEQRIDLVELRRRVDRLTLATMLSAGAVVLSGVSFVLVLVLFVRL